jgi:Zn-dependent protease with chaperone function
VSIAACLLLYSLAVAVLGPGLLARVTRAGIAPRLGVAAWLAAIGTIVLSWAAAAALATAELIRDWNQPGPILGTCLAALRSVALGRFGVPVQIGLLALSALGATAVMALAYQLVRSLSRARTAAHQHARMARLAGRQLAGREAVVLDAPQRVVYCVAGRPHTIVVTSAALDVLDDHHLGAVLAHERAHLAGRHHLLVAITRGLATTLPRIELVRTGATEIARLLEMCADDTATRAHGSPALLGALLTLSGSAPIPTGALSTSGVDVLARAHRLAWPPRPAQRWRTRLLLTAVTILLATGPLLTGMLLATGLALCGSMAG